MRLWHYQLLPYLPKYQLKSQWRECVCIASNIYEHGTPSLTDLWALEVRVLPVRNWVEILSVAKLMMGILKLRKKG